MSANDTRKSEAYAGLDLLERLVGRWEVSGEAEGETSYEWMDGRFHLIQRGQVRREGEEHTFMGFVGFDRPAGATEPAEAITSRLYTSRGETLDYVCESDGDTLTIWFGEKGSPAFYRGRFSEDGDRLEGDWEWPGGGYHEVMTRVKRDS
jgi:hypothetical protein